MRERAWSGQKLQDTVWEGVNIGKEHIKISGKESERKKKINAVSKMGGQTS